MAIWPLVRGQVRSWADRTPVAWRNIVHDKVKMILSIAAVAFAVIIMFMELGFLNGLYDSQTSALEFFDADLVMVSRALQIFNGHETFDRARLVQTAALDGVKGVYPIYVEDTLSDLRDLTSGISHNTRVIGFDGQDAIFRSREANRLIERLRTRMSILFDRKSRSFVGTLRTGTVTELADRAVTVVGIFALGPDYYYDANVLASGETFFRLFPNQSRSEVFLGLIQLKRGASADAVLSELQQRIGPDVEVIKKSDMVSREKGSWRKSTPAGYIFTMGVVVGFVIGVFITYQILYTDIADHLPQLATMKALGYRNRDLALLVLQQALLLGMLGFVPAVIMTFLLYSALTIITGIITKLTLARIALVFSLTLGMCFVSGLLAVRKAMTADPAELF
jgi:putative ABC transport system permease protein